MLSARLGRLVHIALSSTPRVVVLAVLTGAHGNIGNLNVVLSLGGLDMGGADVGYPPTTNTEGPVSMVADFAFANDLTVAVTM